MKNILVLSMCCVFCLVFFAAKLSHANDIKTVDTKGLEEVVASHKGKIILVNFFATWCPPCREEIPGLVKITKDMPSDVVVIGISVDEDPKKLPSFVKDMQINYDLFLAEFSLVEAFKIQTIPHNLVYNQDGKLVANASGFATEEELKKFITLLLEEKANGKSDNS